MLEQNAKDNTGNDAFPGELLKEVILFNSGSSYRESIYVGFREAYYTPETLYAINLNGMYEYSDGEKWNYNYYLSGLNSYDTTRKYWSEHPKIALNDDTMAYWIFSSKNRICGVVRVATSVYESFYAGVGFRFGLPEDYKYPFFVCGTSRINYNYADTSTYHQYFLYPLRAIIVRPDDSYANEGNIKVLPRQDYLGLNADVVSNPNKILYPCMVHDVNNDYLLYELEDVYCLLTNDVQAEDVVQIGADEYLTFPNIFRTEYWEYFAVKKA